jgi:hypothetical protein
MKGFFGPRYTCFGRAGLKRLRKNSWALPVLDPHRGSIKYPGVTPPEDAPPIKSDPERFESGRSHSRLALTGLG